jgi:uncharacterized protein YecE (DUF72 family)
MDKAKCDTCLTTVKIRIGTSGWHYTDWQKRFYPEKLPKSKWLEHYAKHFDTVEINNTFYHQPKEQTFQNWHKQAPRNFLFTVKANRFITHIKRLKEPEEPLERFFKGALLLKEKLGPILYQLPPGLRKNADLLENFLKVLPKKLTAVFEFRHKSWFSKDIYDLLREFNTGFCIHDMPGMKVPRVVTSDVIYVRFHGPTGRYQGNYSKSALQDWAKWIDENLKGKKAAFAYFNNDYNAYAIDNAKTLREQLKNS